jgi:hypothetical protein
VAFVAEKNGLVGVESRVGMFFPWLIFLHVFIVVIYIERERVLRSSMIANGLCFTYCESSVVNILVWIT